MNIARTPKSVPMASIAKITKMKTVLTTVPVQLMVNLLLEKLACMTMNVLKASIAKVTKMKTAMTRVPVLRWTMIQLMTTSQVAIVTTLVGNIMLQEEENGVKISALLLVDK